MNALVPLALLGTGLWAAQPPRQVAAKTEVTQAEQPAVKRSAMQSVEKSIDKRLELTNPADPFDVLGNTRGIYLRGVGVVLSAEVDLVRVPGLSPFHQAIGPEERVRVRARKLQTLPKLREAMKAALLAAAAELRSLPLNENIVFGVTLFYFNGEDASGLPSQIVMQAVRQQLVSPQGQDLIKVQEF